MTTFTQTFQDSPVRSATAKATTRPPVKGGPVLMADCITPVAGETLLSLLWKRWVQDT